MKTPLIRIGLPFLVGVLTVSAGSGQPPEPIVTPKGLKIPPIDPAMSVGPKVLDTAFPDLKPPTRERKEIKTPDGKTDIVVEEKGAVPLPPFPTVGADAPLLRKIQYEQLREGWEYLVRVRQLRVVTGAGSSFHEEVTIASDVYRLAAELETIPAKRVPWLEARVRAMKELEEYTKVRVLNGTVPPQQTNVARLQRLQAEADLLKLKAEVSAATPNSGVCGTVEIVQPVGVSGGPARFFRRR